jgi:hypothetical protein
MGFVAFVLALGFGILVLALGWQPEPGAAPVRWRLTLAAVLHVLCAWLHPAMALFAGVALLTLQGPRLHRKAGWRNLLIVTGPAAAYVVIAYLTARNPVLPPQPHTTGWSNPLEILSGLVEYQVAYSAWELIPRGLAVMILSAVGLPTFVGLPCGATVPNARSRAWSPFSWASLQSPRG